jgi:hypothetical protein
MQENNLLSETNGLIGNYVRTAETDFVSGKTHSSKYVDTSLYEDMSTIYAYLDSKHITGPTDSQDREKPFFNIVLGARNVWYRATDIDRSNIRLRSTKSEDDLKSKLATLKLQEWMRKESFGTFLNAWGLNSAGFNESVLKFVEQDGRLIPSVIPWNKIICDTIDFDNNPKIEILELTEAQLKARKGYDKDMVDSLLNALTTRKTQDGQNKDTKSKYVRLYEVHGEFPLSCITHDPKDDDNFVQQMHVISFILGDNKKDYDDYALYSGRETQDPYMLAALIPEVDGSIGLRGSVKSLFDAQWMQNHSIKAIKDQLDLASQIVYQTDDKNFFGQNALNAIQNGDILIHDTNKPLTLLNNDKSPNLASLQNFRETWKRLGMEIVGISESMLGENPPSGTAWRQTEALLQEGHSLFELMTENKGLSIEKMMRQYILPFIKKQLNNTDEIVATLNSAGIDQLDSRYLKFYPINKANRIIKDRTLNGELVREDQQQELINQFTGEAQQNLETQGAIRYFKPSEVSKRTWKEYLAGMEWEPEVDVTNENVDQNAATTLNTLFQVMASNPMILADPNARMIFNKILELTGTVSPIEIQEVKQPQMAQLPAQPNNTPVQQAQQQMIGAK